MRILIANVYSYKNKGDAAIVISLIQEVERVFKNAGIVIQTADVKHDADRYGKPITSSLLWTLLSSVRDKPLLLRLAKPAFGMAGLWLYLMACKYLRVECGFLLSGELKEFVAQNRKADMVIACGGGYLRTGRSGFRDTMLLAVTSMNFLAPTYLGKKVYLYSQSVGPVHGALQRWMLRCALKKVGLIELREDVSYALVQNMGITTPYVKTADPALLLGGNGVFPQQYISLTPGRLHVGLTVRKWFGEQAKLDAYMKAVAHVIDYLAEAHDAEVFYAPQVIAENFGDDDRIIARKVWELVRHQDRFKVVEADLHPFEVIGLCGSMDIFIGTRMHSNIFALINEVPVVAIEYEHKTKGIMLGLGLDDLIINISDVTASSLQEKVDLLLGATSKYKDLIKKNLPNQIKESRRAIELIKKDYETTTVE